jgi:hypothetical protein
MDGNSTSADDVLPVLIFCFIKTSTANSGCLSEYCYEFAGDLLNAGEAAYWCDFVFVPWAPLEAPRTPQTRVAFPNPPPLVWNAGSPSFKSPASLPAERTLPSTANRRRTASAPFFPVSSIALLAISCPFCLWPSIRWRPASRMHQVCGAISRSASLFSRASSVSG